MAKERRQSRRAMRKASRGCDVPLGLCEGLLACPLPWDDVAVCVPHFEVVSEDVVVAYFERLYPCALCLTLLQLHEVVL